MSSLFDKLRTLAKATTPGRRDPYKPSDFSSDDDLAKEIARLEREVAELEAKQAALEAARTEPSDEQVVEAVMEELAADSAELPASPNIASDALKQELMAESAEIEQRVDATNDAAQAVADKAVELTEQATSDNTPAPITEAVVKPTSESDALVQQIEAESAEIQQKVERTNDAAQAVADKAADLTEQVRDAKQLKQADEATLAEARRALDSAEQEIVGLPSTESDAVKRSAAQAQELIKKARAYIGEKSAQAPTGGILRKASDALDAATKGIHIPTDASDTVRKSAQQANELIEKARRLIAEKQAALGDGPNSAEAMPDEIIEADVPAPPPSSAASSQLDDIKRRLG